MYDIRSLPIIIAFFFVLFVIILRMSVTLVHDYELVMVHRLGALNDVPVEPGMRWFWPFIDTVHRFDTREKRIVIEEVGRAQQLEGIAARTRDHWTIGAKTFVHYTISKDIKSAQELIRIYGLEDSSDARQQMEARISDEVRHAIQNLSPQYSLDYLLTHRAELINNVQYVLGYAKSFLPGSQNELVEDGTEKKVLVQIPAPMFGSDQPGSRLVDLGLRIQHISIDFWIPKAAQEAAQRIAEEKEKLDWEIAHLKVVEVQRKNAVEEAKGIAEAARIRLSARDSLSFAAQFFDSWNGELPPTLVVGDNGARALIGLQGEMTNTKEIQREHSKTDGTDNR